MFVLDLVSGDAILDSVLGMKFITSSPRISKEFVLHKDGGDTTVLSIHL
jgi:hypothetical protein